MKLCEIDRRVLAAQEAGSSREREQARKPQSHSTAATRFHEAGHAVAAVLLSVSFDYVTVEPFDDSLGHIWRSTDDDDEFAIDPVVKAIFILAGPCAESRRMRTGIRGAYVGQQDAADLAAMNLSDDDFKKAVIATYEMLDARWPAVRRVAKAFRSRSRLDFEDVENLVFQA